MKRKTRLSIEEIKEVCKLGEIVIDDIMVAAKDLQPSEVDVKHAMSVIVASLRNGIKDSEGVSQLDVNALFGVMQTVGMAIENATKEKIVIYDDRNGMMVVKGENNASSK